MASTTFTSGTPVTKEWLNDVNSLTYGTSTTTNSSSFWPDVSTDVQMHRMSGRLFVYDGVTFTGNFSGTQSGFVPTSTEGAAWAPRDSAFFAASKRGLMAITGFASNENMPAGAPTETIGVSGFAIAKQSAKSAWGLYSDLQFESGTYGYGLEIAVKNKSTNQTSTPYFATTGTYGIWLPGGGDSTYGGSPANPSNTAIAIGKNATTWNKGIVFFKDGLTGADGTTGTATAIEMGKGHRVVWLATGGYAGFAIRSDVNAAASDTAMTAINNAVVFSGANGKNMLQIGHSSGAVNWLGINNSASGSSVSLYANSDGTDSNVNILVTPLGNGSVVLSSVRNFANDAAAAAATPPVPIGGIYRNGSAMQIRVT